VKNLLSLSAFTPENPWPRRFSAPGLTRERVSRPRDQTVLVVVFEVIVFRAIMAVLVIPNAGEATPIAPPPEKSPENAGKTDGKARDSTRCLLIHCCF